MSPTTGPCRTYASQQQHTRHLPPGSLRLWTPLQHRHWRWASSGLWLDVMQGLLCTVTFTEVCPS